LRFKSTRFAAGQVIAKDQHAVLNGNNPPNELSMSEEP
jgi:hypothetical protein